MLSRFRMDVVCASGTEAVTHAGGLICDRSLTGWDVRVFAMDDDTGADPGLHTLGASRAEGRPEESAQQELLRAIVVSGDLFRNDEGIRRWVHSAMGEPLIEVLVWDIGRPMTDIRHIEVPVSRAALLFLDHARAAAGCEPSSQTSELFCQLRTGRPQYAVRRPNVLTTVNGV